MTKPITFNGITQSKRKWAKCIGVDVSVLCSRMKRGWSIEECMSPPRQCERHGKHGSPEHRAWSGMISRCENKTHKAYKNYGKRGISVCCRWRSSFLAFYEDMGRRPDGLELDRIDNESGYFCGKCDDCASRGVTKINCRWATISVQMKNRRTALMITINGITKNLADWAREYGTTPQRVSQRVNVLGWTFEKALSTPPNTKHCSRFKKG